MTTEWIAVVVAMVAVGATITIAVVAGFRRLGDRIGAVDQRLGDRMAALEQRMGGVEQRVAYLAGLIEGQRGAPQAG